MGEEKSGDRSSRRVGNWRNTGKYETMVNVSQSKKGYKGGSLEKRGGTQEVWTPLERYPVFENYKLPKIPPEFGRNSSFNSYLRAKSSI